MVNVSAILVLDEIYDIAYRVYCFDVM